MKSSKFYLVSVFLLISVTLNAQNEIARAYYLKAKEAYSENKYEAVLDYLENATKELGSTNPDFIYLELIARYNLNKKDQKIKNLATEFINAADKNDTRVQEVSLIVVEQKDLLEKNIKEENVLYNQAVSSKSILDLRTYLKKFPERPERINTIEKILSQQERELFEDAKKSNTLKD